MNKTLTGLLILILAAITPREALALTTGGEGNTPVTEHGWPRGASAIFNHPGRVAWWEGPGLGGQWHSECRGDTKAFQAVLADFANLDVKARRVVVHDGTGYSFWLAPNREPTRRDGVKIDWDFVVWETAVWDQLHKLPPDLNPTDRGATGPPAQIDVYTAGIDWAGVTVPEGVEVIDQRLEAHGFTPADGVVIEGKVTDIATGRPLAASVRLQRVDPQKAGGYLYPVVAETKADAAGHWVVKHAPVGWLRVVAEADGFVPRVAGYARLDDQPRWHSFDAGLARPAAVAGRVVDDAGKPIAGVEVRLVDVMACVGDRYESPPGFVLTTDAEGRFRAGQVPAGKATVWVNKPGYVRSGLGLPVTTPAEGIELSMTPSATVRVSVDFTGKVRPEGYIVELEPEGGNVIGSFGGSGNIDAANRIAFENVPPGRYALRGHPNPSSGDQWTEPVNVDLKGGQTAEVTLKAK